MTLGQRNPSGRRPASAPSQPTAVGHVNAGQAAWTWLGRSRVGPGGAQEQGAAVVPMVSGGVRSDSHFYCGVTATKTLLLLLLLVIIIIVYANTISS